MSVFIVDDDDDIRESLVEIFQDEGFAVQAAADGAQALERLRDSDAGAPCVVILDLLMPVIDGLEVYEQMQADPRLAGVPVIVSTSDPSRAPSGVLIMKKPVDLSRLLNAVKQYCAC